jgi:hypothetical protein
MPRPPRIELADAVCHVTSRGNARRQIFFTDGDRQRFLRQLRDNLVTYGVVLYARCAVGSSQYVAPRSETLP